MMRFFVTAIILLCGTYVAAATCSLDSEIKAITQMVNDFKTSTEQRLDGMQSEITEIGTGHNWKTKSVSFSARLGVQYKMRKGGTIRFKTIINNDGDGYNSTTGIFTAPIAGKYWFSTTINVYPKTYAYVQLMRNRDEMARLQTDARNSRAYNRDTGSVSTVMNLRQGDAVYCMWMQGSTSGVPNIYGTYANSFAGVLLSEV